MTKNLRFNFLMDHTLCKKCTATNEYLKGRGVASGVCVGGVIPPQPSVISSVNCD